MDYLLWVCSLVVPAVLAVEGTSLCVLSQLYFCLWPPWTNNGADRMDESTNGQATVYLYYDCAMNRKTIKPKAESAGSTAGGLFPPEEDVNHAGISASSRVGLNHHIAHLRRFHR